MTYFLLRGQPRGPEHIDVHVWGGTESQAHQHARPKMGVLTMGYEQWQNLVDQLRRLDGHGPAIFDIDQVQTR